MKILSITAGAAGMYCGSCARDNTLAGELVARGHDVTLVPVYTPTRTDEPNLSRDHVLFSGISVCLQQSAGIFRKTPRFLDGLWDSPWFIQKFAGRSISVNPRFLGDLTISMLRGEEGLLRKEYGKLLDWVASNPLPDVINLPNSLLISLAAPLRKRFQRPVCCTLQGEELFLNGLQPPYRQQALDLIRQQVRHVDRFIAVSDFCSRFMSDFLAIPREKMAVVPLGINLEGYDPSRSARGAADEFCIGYFARVAPEKGLHLLADAYVLLRKKTAGARIRLEAAGTLLPDDRAYLESARRALEQAGLADEFAYRGTLDRDQKIAFLRDVDVLCVPATHDEPKGLFVIEAMAAGTPVVQPRRGAFTEMIEKTGGGLLVEPDNAENLAEGLYTLWQDRALRETLGQRAAQGVRAHYTIAHSADRLFEVYDQMARNAAHHEVEAHGSHDERGSRTTRSAGPPGSTGSGTEKFV
jgi:glycosyltransferase involved in cell wall biosynthesis